MRYLEFELSKLLYRRYTLGLLVATLLLFPVIVGAISYLNVAKDLVPAEQFPRNVAYGILAYSQSYLFIPVWIIVFPSLELSQGHMSRVIFMKSRRFFFISKICYCGIVTVFYTLLGLGTLIIIFRASSLDFAVGGIFYLKFFVQMALSTFVFSILLLCLVFLVKSTVAAFVVFLAWGFVENIVFTLAMHWYNVQLRFLPLHLVRSVYVRNGEAGSENFYFPIVSDGMQILMGIALLFLGLAFVYWRFLRADLPALSD